MPDESTDNSKCRAPNHRTSNTTTLAEIKPGAPRLRSRHVRSVIDTSFDVRTDARGRDPDSHSATLRRYHQLLWSKPLPDGTPFELDAKLYYTTGLGTFWLASDAITHTYLNWTAPTRLVEA